MHPASHHDPIRFSSSVAVVAVEGSLTLPGEQCGGGRTHDDDTAEKKLLGGVMIFLIVDSGISACGERG